jgi:hypothetical protein
VPSVQPFREENYRVRPAQVGCGRLAVERMLLRRKGPYSKSECSHCPQCEVLMFAGPKPLMRIFGDVRTFECVPCKFMLLLEYPVRSVASASNWNSANGRGGVKKG